MKKKSVIATAVTLSLVAAIGVGSTLAYFTDSDSTQNVVTMGHVDITLTEPNFDYEDNTITDVTPNQEIAKDPTITVADSSEDCYVRAEVSYDGLSDAQVEDLKDGINFGSDWTLGSDGYYYYNDKLSAGETAVLFDTVTIPEDWGNEVADISFNINVKAEAIQADNFTPATDANGKINNWLDSKDQAITAETYKAN